MRIDADVAIELASHEGLVRQAYKDSKGIWTWSIGITSMSGHSVERYIGKPQTLEHCLAIYVWALERYAADVRKAFAAKPLNKHQFAAALSFHYNTGAIGRASWVKKWLAGDVAGARKSFMDWSKPAEIVPRRQKERDLFFNGTWSNTGTVTEYARLKASGAPDWSSAVRTNIRPAMESVFGATTAPPAPAKPSPAPVPQQRPEAAPEPPVAEEKLSHSKRFWTWLSTGGGTALLPFVDWRIQMVIVLFVLCLATYAIVTMPKAKAALMRVFGL